VSSTGSSLTRTSRRPSTPIALVRHLEARGHVHAGHLPHEGLRDALSPIRVLHEAVTCAGIADAGPMLPHRSNLPAAEHPRVRAAAGALWAHDRSLV